MRDGDGQAQLVRYWAYGYKVAQVAPSSLGVTPAVLADKVSGCDIVYDTYNAAQRPGGNHPGYHPCRGKLRLYHEIHVNNIP